jgi:signal transduction histidine kinase
MFSSRASMPSTPETAPSAALSARGFSIQTRLIALVLAVLLPTLCAAVWVLNLTYRMERDASERLLEETTRALSMVLDRELTQRAVAVRALSGSSLLDTAPDLSPADLRDFDREARRMLTGLEGWLELRNARQVLVNTRQPPDASLRNASLPALIGSPAIQPMRQDPRLGIQYATLVQPVLRNGQPVLNLSLTVLPHEFQRIVDEQRLADGWLAAIIDSNGRVVARHPGGGAHTGRSATPDLKAQLDAGREGLMHSTSLDGHPVTLYFHTSPQGWTYVTGMSRPQFDGALPRAMLQVAAGMLALFVISLLGAAWVARRIVGPIQTIKQMATDLREGQPLPRTRTGLLECDQVALALHDAGHAIRHARDELEQQVAEAVERTRNLEQHASHNHRVEALGRLTGGIAHEFNNLLGIISNCAHLIRRLAPAQALQPALNATLNAVDTGSRLTQHLLRFSGRQAVHPRLLRLQTFLPDAVELLRTLLERRIELATQVDPATPAVRVDPNELELSLINLALNAREAIRGHGHLWLEASSATPEDLEGLAPGSYARITVRDDGEGMDERVAQHAFEPFFSTREPHQVAGLGLSQVYGFCLQAGGRALLKSTPGAGTTVTLLLPAHTGEPDSGLDELPSPTAIAGARVLLVEDNEALCQVTATVLRSDGCEVVCAPSAQEALRLVGMAPGFDAVVSDVQMPGAMDGVALATRLRQILPNLPVVLISGHPGKTTPPPGIRLVRKPCPPEVLVAAIAKAMGRGPPA